jgi:uncharacterized protein YxeA
MENKKLIIILIIFILIIGAVVIVKSNKSEEETNTISVQKVITEELYSASEIVSKMEEYLGEQISMDGNESVVENTIKENAEEDIENMEIEDSDNAAEKIGIVEIEGGTIYSFSDSDEAKENESEFKEDGIRTIVKNNVLLVVNNEYYKKYKNAILSLQK